MITSAGRTARADASDTCIVVRQGKLREITLAQLRAGDLLPLAKYGDAHVYAPWAYATGRKCGYFTLDDAFAHRDILTLVPVTHVQRCD